MTIRLPARPGAQDVLATAPTAARGGRPETDPPDYTEQVGPESVVIQRAGEEPTNSEPEQTPELRSEERQETHPEGSQDTSLVEPKIEDETIDGLHEHDIGEGRGAAPREEVQRVQITLDPEITETIRQMAREQRELRAGIEDSRRETGEIRAMVKTHEFRLDRVFKRVGDIIDDQWTLCAGIDELKELQRAAKVQEKIPARARTPIKTEPVSPTLGMGRTSSPAPEPVAATMDIESLYASDENDGTGRQHLLERDRMIGGSAERSNVEGQQQNAMGTPGEEWIRNRQEDRQRFGLATDEALERWRLASEASRERRVQRQQGRQEPQLQKGAGVQNASAEPGTQGQRRSVTQPHEVGFGRRPNLPTPSGSERQASNHGNQPPDGSSSGSSDDPRQGGGPDNRSRTRSSDTRGRSRTGSHVSQRHRGDDDHPRRRRRKRSPSYSSSSSSPGDWDSDYTVLDDEGRRSQERRKRRRDPKTEYEQEQLRKIRERIRKMVGQDIQYAATYKGVKDIVTIVRYAGQNDNGIFTRWLDHLLLYFQLNRMCGPDNELVRLSAMYNSLEGVAEEWYRDLILHSPKRSWTFEKAACSLFLTYVFGSAASHAAREFNEVKYSRTEGAREYAQRLKAKARHLARKPDESTMIVRFLSGLPGDLSRRLTLRERLDPARHEFRHFVAKLHELEEAENVTKTVNVAVVDEQRKAVNQGPRQPQVDNRRSPREFQRISSQPQNHRVFDRRPDERQAKGKGPTPDSTCFRCQGKGHYSNSPACPMFGKDGGRDRQLRDRPQLKAVRASGSGTSVVLDDQSDDVGETGEWDDGSQWESTSEGGGSLHSREEPQRLTRISLGDISSGLEDDDHAYVRAVREKVVEMRKENPSRAAMYPKIDRPRRSKAHESCLATYVTINGMEAFALFDSGSSADTISPDFAQVSDARVHTLDRPVPLQLGTVGSRASINYGTWTSVGLGGRTEDRYYLDVVNIDRYDAILGAPFMRKFGIRLDFENNSIVVGGMAIEALLPEEEAALLKGREIRRGGQRH